LSERSCATDDRSCDSPTVEIELDIELGEAGDENAGLPADLPEPRPARAPPNRIEPTKIFSDCQPRRARSSSHHTPPLQQALDPSSHDSDDIGHVVTCEALPRMKAHV
jgi:hypothetical protein